MEPKDINILKLLDTLQEKPNQSKRELSEKLNLSLGLVNKLIREQVSQGFIKTDKLVKNKIKYALSVKGVTKKIELEKKQVSHYIGCYKKIKTMVEKGLNQIKGKSENHILLYGTGELCEIACMFYDQRNCNNIIIIDDKNAGKKVNGFLVHNEEEMENKVYDAILIMELRNTKQVRSMLVGKGIPSDKIYQIFT